MAKTGRNELCPCGSGLKYKKCHGDPVKISACNMIAQLKMKELIMTERIKKGLVCKHGKKLGEYCKNCGEEGVIGKGIYIVV